MKRFRFLQLCNKNGKAHIWVCPWLRDNKTDPFDEWIIKLNQPAEITIGMDYFVDIFFNTWEVAITPVGSLQWVIFSHKVIESIARPTPEDYKALGLTKAPDLPWIFTSNFSLPDKPDCSK